MKQRLTILFFACAFAVNAQFKEVKYLKSVDNTVVYQRVFEFAGDKSSVLRLLKSGPFTDADSTGAMLTDWTISKKYLSGAGLPVYMHGTWSGRINLDIKDGKYRVTVTNLKTYVPLALNFGGASAMPTKEDVAKLALKKDGSFKPSQDQSMIVLSDALSELFVIKETGSDEW